MTEVEIIRRNIERFRHLLQSELDNPTRLSVEKLLAEFEGKLSAAKASPARTENAGRMKCSHGNVVHYSGQSSDQVQGGQ